MEKLGYAQKHASEHLRPHFFKGGTLKVLVLADGRARLEVREHFEPLQFARANRRELRRHCPLPAIRLHSSYPLQPNHTAVARVH